MNDSGLLNAKPQVSLRVRPQRKKGRISTIKTGRNSSIYLLGQWLNFKLFGIILGLHM